MVVGSSLSCPACAGPGTADTPSPPAPRPSAFPSLTGESGLGKTTLINTLFSTELSQAKNHRARFAKQLDKTTEVDIIKAEVRPRRCVPGLLAGTHLLRVLSPA